MNLPLLADVQLRYVTILPNRVAAQQKTPAELVELNEAAECWKHPTTPDHPDLDQSERRASNGF